ncbi:HNH endonuclease signature motif containing protein [Micromonospora profundi]|uniref:HNH endonuclease signature motif containing protein n=1 Tax=Micromonospora profundi TaxID=1420889 RepID=UPI002FF2DA3E
MNVDNFVAFFNKAAEVQRGKWSRVDVPGLAAYVVPQQLYGMREELLKADLATAHAKWFLDGLVDPAPFAIEGTSYTFAHFAERLRETVMVMLADIPADEADKVWRALSRLAWDDIQGRRLSDRIRWSKALRQDLWDSIANPHCYLCGFKFSREAEERFLTGGRIEVPLPNLTDFVRARTKPRHVRIEVDHVLPLVDGGTNNLDNLRLACGWCNSAKGRYGSIYDTHSWSEVRFEHPGLGWLTIPRPLWVLRIVSLRGRCEDVSCLVTIDQEELRVAPWWAQGALTPPNIKVFCADHDTWKANRFVSSALLDRR